MASSTQTPPKPSPAPASPRPPKTEPYPDLFFVEGKALGGAGEHRSR